MVINMIFSLPRASQKKVVLKGEWRKLTQRMNWRAAPTPSISLNKDDFDLWIMQSYSSRLSRWKYGVRNKHNRFPFNEKWFKVGYSALINYKTQVSWFLGRLRAGTFPLIKYQSNNDRNSCILLNSTLQSMCGDVFLCKLNKLNLH